MPLLARNRPPRRTWSSPVKPRLVEANKARGSLTASGALTPSGLVASGQRVTRSQGDSVRRLHQAWQEQAFAYYDLLGEIKYAAQFYSRALAKLRLYAAERDDQGEIKETNNPVAIATLERVQDPGGGRSGLLASYGRLMFLTGEAYLLASRDPETELEAWEMLSSAELRFVGNKLERVRAPQMAPESLEEPSDDQWDDLSDGQAIPYRLWRRHPRYSYLADSTMQGVLELCEELLILTRAVRARARSRLAGSGVLAVDERLSPNPQEAVGDEDALNDPFLADLIEAMTASIAEEGAASAVVPLLVRGQVPDGMKISDLIYHLQLVDPTQLYPEEGLRKECIHRIAMGLDMPPEILEGLTDANHWTGWLVDDQTWTAHLQPVAQQLVDDLSASFYRPTLRDAGLADWQRYVIAYDPADVINHPDKSKDAKDLYDRRAIGKKPLREAAGFTDDDEMPPDELAESLGVALKDATLATTGEVSPPSAPPSPGGEGPPPEAEPSGEAPPAEDTGVGPQTNGPPPGVGEALGAASFAVLRSHEAAGNRLRSLAKKDQELRDMLVGVPARKVAKVLGPENVRRLYPDGDLALVVATEPLLDDALRQGGIVDPEQRELIVRAVERHAARTLYDENPAALPSQIENFIAGVLKARNGRRPDAP